MRILENSFYNNLEMQKMRFKHQIWAFVLTFGLTFLFNEFLIYYLVLYQCKWPSRLNDPVNVMLLAVTHLLGPFKGHWFDKFRREWQMQRTFQTAIWLHQPDVVFILGDIFDEGQWVNDDYFKQYLLRYHEMFRTPEHIKVYSAVGNHDVGFHYRLHPYVLDRFKTAFNESSNKLITVKNTHFVLLNSMTLSRDGCYFCANAEAEIQHISHSLKCAKKPTYKNCDRLTEKLSFYGRPVLLQHFPTYRESDRECEEHDAPKIEEYRESWEVLSKDATTFLGKVLNPFVAFSGHSHHYCRLNNTLGVEEFTLASFSWRNKPNPSFLLAEFTKNEYAVSKCDMPNEYTVITIYILSACLYVLYLIRCIYRSRIRKKTD